ALLGSSPVALVVFDAAVAANIAALVTSAAPRTASTCFLAMVPPLLAFRGDSASLSQRRFRQYLAAVDDQRLAGDVARLRRGEEADGPADLLGLGVAAHRDRGEHPLLVLVARVGEPGRADVPGEDGVDRDSTRCELHGRGTHEAEHRCLRRAVVCEARLPRD